MTVLSPMDKLNPKTLLLTLLILVLFIAVLWLDPGISLALKILYTVGGTLLSLIITIWTLFGDVEKR